MMEHHPSRSRLTDADRLALRGISVKTAIREIAAEVCAQTGLTEADLFSPSRAAEHVRARDVIWTVAHREGWTLQQIAKAFSRDHSTVHAGIAREKERREAAETSCQI